MAPHYTITPHHTQHITAHGTQPKLAILLCENSGAVVEWLMDKFNLDVRLVNFVDDRDLCLLFDYRICCSECPFPKITVTGFIFRTVIFDQVFFTDFIFQSANSE